MQKTFFDIQPNTHIVNGASVPHRSPFRYPEGKTWLIPHIRRWLSPTVRKTFNLSPVHPQLLCPIETKH